VLFTSDDGSQTYCLYTTGRKVICIPVALPASTSAHTPAEETKDSTSGYVYETKWTLRRIYVVLMSLLTDMLCYVGVLCYSCLLGSRHCRPMAVQHLSILHWNHLLDGRRLVTSCFCLYWPSSVNIFSSPAVFGIIGRMITSHREWGIDVVAASMGRVGGSGNYILTNMWLLLHPWPNWAVA